jgi:hypothetical protein
MTDSQARLDPCSGTCARRTPSSSSCGRATFGDLPTRLVVTEDEPHPSPELVTVAAPPEPGWFSPAMPSACPTVGRGGAANDRQPGVTSGQLR